MKRILVITIGSVLVFFGLTYQPSKAQGGNFYHLKVCQVWDQYGNLTQIGNTCVMGYSQCVPNNCDALFEELN
ncbi:MAG: hypothetical protein ACQEW9_08400 [Bacteroidota bacterium]